MSAKSTRVFERFLTDPKEAIVLVVVSLVVIVASMLANWYLDLRSKMKRLPPGNPYIDQTFALMFRSKAGESPYIFLREGMRKYGPIFTTRLLGKPAVVIAGGEAFRSVLMKDFDLVGPGMPEQIISLLGPHSAATMTDRARHKAVRLLWTQYLSPSYVADHYTRTLALHARRILEEWAQQDRVVFYDEAKRLAFSLMLACILEFEFPRDELAALLRDFNLMEQGLWACVPLKVPGFTYYKAHEARKRIMKVIVAVLDKFQGELDRKAQDPGYQYKHTLLHSFLEFRFPDGSTLTRDELLDNSFGLFFGGFDTTATSMTMMLSLLDLRPDVFARVKEEQRRIVAQHGEEITKEAYDAMELTHACIKEALRVRTVGNSIMRTAKKDIEINGYVIPAGFMLFVSFENTMCLDPKVATPGDAAFSHCNFTPEAFRPERWLDPETRPSAYYPFSSGPHQCAGLHFALREMTVFLAVLARGFDFELLDKSREWSPFMMPKFKSLVPIRFTKA